MSGYGLEQLQRASQAQVQRMSQQQILAMRLLAMGSQELRDEIFKKAEENPALEIARDPFSEGASSVRKGAVSSSDGIHTRKADGAGIQAADTFQKLLESSPDRQETLQEHLLSQLNMMHLSDREYGLCRRLITNLDESGFHILAPASLLPALPAEAPELPARAQALLDRCISIVQHFDPAGICVANVNESLLLQAELDGSAPPLARFFLNGHLEMLLPPVPEKIRRKLLDWLSGQEELSFKNGQEAFPAISKKDASEAAVGEAVRFIHSLNPFPAAEFSAGSAAHYIRPDIYVVRCSGELEQELPEKGLVLDGMSAYFRISLANDVLPAVRVSTDFQNSGIAERITSKDGQQFVRAKLKDARTFIETLAFRGEIILRSCSLLVRSQKDFFRSGPGHLLPLSQRQFAQSIGVHESTVSRMADSKFLHCDWGTFPLKYFFTTSVARPQDVEPDGAAAVSSDTIRRAILEIIKSQPPSAKRLSDQKLADELASRGYSVARRTVAKYRSQLNIESSYRR